MATFTSKKYNTLFYVQRPEVYLSVWLEDDYSQIKAKPRLQDTRKAKAICNQRQLCSPLGIIPPQGDDNNAMCLLCC